jgi:hypothetical protein
METNGGWPWISRVDCRKWTWGLDRWRHRLMQSIVALGRTYRGLVIRRCGHDHGVSSEAPSSRVLGVILSFAFRMASKIGHRLETGWSLIVALSAVRRVARTCSDSAASGQHRRQLRWDVRSAGEGYVHECSDWLWTRQKRVRGRKWRSCAADRTVCQSRVRGPVGTVALAVVSVGPVVGGLHVGESFGLTLVKATSSATVLRILRARTSWDVSGAG